MQKKLNIHEAKTHLSALLAELKEGDKIILCRRNVPVAEVIPIETTKIKKKKIGKRPFGLAKNSFDIPESFFEPLPDSVLKDFGL